MTDAGVVAGDGDWLLRSCYRVLVSYTTRFVLCFCFGVLSFLPLLTNEVDYMENTVTASSLRDGRLYYESCIVILSLAVPLLIDMACDVSNALTKRSKAAAPSAKSKRAKASTDSLTLPEKSLVITGLVIFPAMAFVPTTTPNFMLIWLCTRRAQQMLVFLPIFASWCRLFPAVFPPFWVTVCTFCIGVGQMISSYQVNRKCSPTPPANINTLNIVVLILTFPGLFMFLCRGSIWLYRTGWQLFRPVPVAKETFTTTRLSSAAGSNAKDTGPSDHERDALYFPWLYILLTFSSVTIIGVMGVIFNADGNTNVRLLFHNCSIIITELCLVNFYLRRVKFEALNNLYALIDSKKSYVRYIRYFPSLLLARGGHIFPP